MPDISLFGLGKPANTFVEKVANAIGRHFDPSQTVRIAEAQAKAHHILEVNKAETNIEVAQLRERAATRIINEEMANQTNIETITERAINYLNEDATPQGMGDDWVRNAIDKSKMVSDEDMQDWWARILAGEANHPGSFSRRTVNLMADLDKSDAELFESLCIFVWMLQGNKHPLIFDMKHEIYGRHGINFISTGHLESLGLVRLNSMTGFKIDPAPSPLRVSYYGRRKLLTIPNNPGHQFSIGMVMFTQPGIELSQVCKSNPEEDCFNYVCDRWRKEGLVNSQ